MQMYLHLVYQIAHVSADDQAAEEYGWYAAFAAENEGIAGKIWQ